MNYYTNNQYILAIDPGNKESAYCIIEVSTYKPLEFGKEDNKVILEIIEEFKKYNDDKLAVIEMVACYGMAVGEEIFETCKWIGRFEQKLLDFTKVKFIYRKEEKMNLCHTMKAKDSNIRQALIDRFGVVGTKKNPGWFYGFKADIWQAYAVGITYLDKEKDFYELPYYQEI